MKKSYILIFVSLLGVYSHSQISFEKGYFIDNLDERTECLIRNVAWKNNPVEIEYKLSENGETDQKTMRYVSEFGIYTKAKYNRFKVKIDRSSKMLGNLGTDRSPDFKEEQLLLKVLVEGTASLFMYEDGSLRRFFYSVGDSRVKQLVYKQYKAADYKVKENNEYMNQLWNDLKCPAIHIEEIKKLNYSKSELVRFFVKFNECNNFNFTNYSKNPSKNSFNLSLRPGVNASALTLDSSTLNSRDAQFDSKMEFRLGLEAEFVMPFNGKKWAFFVEPTYQYFEAEKQLERYFVKASYKSIELPLGIRHYMFLNEKSKLFINGAVVLDFAINSVLDYDTVGDVEMRSSPNLAFGFGYKMNNKLSLELRYHTSRDVVTDSQSYSSDYKAVAFIFGYSLF